MIQGNLFNKRNHLGANSTNQMCNFVRFEPMNEAEIADEGKALTIEYLFAETILGNVFLASTKKGICQINFVATKEIGLLALQKQFNQAQLIEEDNNFHQLALSYFMPEPIFIQKLPLHIIGTKFQLNVWEALLQIPFGQKITYGELADQLKIAGGSRAIGTAIGKNAIAFIIPCHRVVQASGAISGYRWGPELKRKILTWELGILQA